MSLLDGAAPTRRLATVIAVTALVVLGLSGGVLASHGFSDVPDSHPFHDEIAWMKDTGISTGFNDGTFKPSSNVTRQAMAAFMYRLAGADPSVDPSVNASHVGGIPATSLLAGIHGRLGYAFACQPEMEEYDPALFCNYHHNSEGGDITISRSATGTYTVLFAGLGSPGDVPPHDGGHVQVTAWGETYSFCKVNGWGSQVNASIVVNCYDADGALMDSEFDVLFVF